MGLKSCIRLLLVATCFACRCLPFWINIFNMAMMHGLFLRGPPSGFWGQVKQMKDYKYNIGGKLLCLSDVEV